MSCHRCSGEAATASDLSEADLDLTELDFTSRRTGNVSGNQIAGGECSKIMISMKTYDFTWKFDGKIVVFVMKFCLFLPSSRGFIAILLPLLWLLAARARSPDIRNRQGAPAAAPPAAPLRIEIEPNQSHNSRKTVVKQ